MFKIDGREFTIGIESLQRSIKKNLKYDVVTEDGVRHTEIKSMHQEYSLTLGSINQAEYDALYATVNTYAQSLSVTLPDGQSDTTFDATVEMGGDALVLINSDGTRRWDGLTLTITSITPIGR